MQLKCSQESPFSLTEDFTSSKLKYSLTLTRSFWSTLYLFFWQAGPSMVPGSPCLSPLLLALPLLLNLLSRHTLFLLPPSPYPSSSGEDHTHTISSSDFLMVFHTFASPASPSTASLPPLLPLQGKVRTSSLASSFPWITCSRHQV